MQIGTANFYNPSASVQILDALPAALAELQAVSVADVVKTLVRNDSTTQDDTTDESLQRTTDH